MNTPPNSVLLSRALFALQSAKLQLQDGQIWEAVTNIETAVANLERVEGL